MKSLNPYEDFPLLNAPSLGKVYYIETLIIQTNIVQVTIQD